MPSTTLRWLLGALTVTSLSVGAAFLLARELAGCYVRWVPLGQEPLCGPGVWGATWVPAVLLLVGAVLLVVWAAAAVRTAVGQFGAARRFHHRLLAAAVDHPVADDASARLGVPVVVADVPAPVAVTVGALRPSIVLSTGLLDRLDVDEVEAVLRHEQHHAQQRHPLLYGVVRVVADALFVLPVVGRWADQEVVDAEVAADHAAIEQVGRRPLLSALHTAGSAADMMAPAAYGSLHGMLDRRIEVLAGRRSRRTADRTTRWLSAAGALVVAAPLVGLAVAVPRAGWWTDDVSCSPLEDPDCVPPPAALEEPGAPSAAPVGPGAAPPAAVDGMLPVVDLTGAPVGHVEEAASNRVARQGGRAPVVDDDGVQVGWWTTDGFEPLSASEPAGDS